MKQKPDLKFWGLWNLSFGFLGVQIAYALQSANITRIFSTLGADPHSLSFFWILPPLMGMIVQPLIGKFSDKTWCRWGRRIPYLFLGAAFAVAVMCLLPNAGSLHLDSTAVVWGGMSAVMLFGLFMLMLLDTSINIAMQPFKMLVGDMVNEKQKKRAYGIQSALCNAGSIIGFIFPSLLTAMSIKNTAEEGVVPDSVIFSFYAGAAILIICVIYTVVKVKEWDPQTYAEYNEDTTQTAIDGLSEATAAEPEPSMLKLLAKAPAAFWQIGLVQFFCWAAFLYSWTYCNGTVAINCFDTPVINGELDTASEAYQLAGNFLGNIMAIQAVAAMLWAVVIPRIKNTRLGYSVSLVLGGIGFAAMYWAQSETEFIICEALMGCTWAAMLAYPFTLLTNALQGKGHMGTYLGLFNCTICLPQIIAAATGGLILQALPLTENGSANQPMMMLFGGLYLIAGAIAVFGISKK